MLGGSGGPHKIILIGMDGMNLPLLRRFMRERCLPTFTRLMERGATNRLLSAIPAWTPTNWATMVTGAPAGTHGLGGWSVRRRTDRWDAPRLHSWHADAMTAEALWDVADQAGRRSLVTFYPSGCWPSHLRHGYVVAPGFHDSPFPIAPPVQFFCSTRPDVPEGRASGGRDAVRAGGRTGRTVDTAEEGVPPGSVLCRLAPVDPRVWRGAPAGALAATLPIPLLRGGESRLALLIPRRADGAFEPLLVCDGLDASRILAEVRPGEWSRFAIREWLADGSEERAAAEGSVRFRLLSANVERGEVRLLSSQVYATRGFAAPEGLDRHILEHCGPFFDTFSVGPTAGIAERDAFLDDIRYQGEWEVRVARYVGEHRGWDLHFNHWHLFDHINHPTVNAGDPDGPDYDPEVGDWMIDCQRRTYQVGDEVLSHFLELADEQTYVCVISDHAMAPAHRWGHATALLQEQGLLVMQEGGRGIDFSRSRVYVMPDRGSEVWVNLRGREPMGAVPSEEYEQVQEAVIDALLDWRDPGNRNRRVVALALKLQDAQLIGFWGDVCGDVVFTFNRGYGWGPPLEGGSVGRGRGAQHGSQVPTSETPHFANMGCFILAGPRVRAGYERDWQRYGMMRMIDVAPTLAHLAGLRPPAQNMGAVLYDLLESG